MIGYHESPFALLRGFQAIIFYFVVQVTTVNQHQDLDLNDLGGTLSWDPPLSLLRVDSLSPMGLKHVSGGHDIDVGLSLYKFPHLGK